MTSTVQDYFIIRGNLNTFNESKVHTLCKFVIGKIYFTLSILFLITSDFFYFFAWFCCHGFVMHNPVLLYYFHHTRFYVMGE